MYATLKGLAAIVTLAAAAACTDLRSEPLLPAPETALEAKAGGTLTFTSTTSHSEEWPQTAVGTTGAIEFTGSLTTSTPCFDVRAAHRASGSTITLTVTARSTGGTCIQVITHHNYQGAVSKLAPGTYTFEVVHDVGGRQTVFSEMVTVR